MKNSETTENNTSKSGAQSKRKAIVPRATKLVVAKKVPLGDSATPTLELVSNEDVDYFESIFGLRIKDVESFTTALTHRSLQFGGEKSHYERLEFLGDAVLDLAVADLLINAHPHASEGELSKMRAALVNTQSLAEIARSFELGKFIRLSRGELSSGGAKRPSILADVVEAILGAIYLEFGFTGALSAISKLFGSKVTHVSPSDPKTELQEILHTLGKGQPSYRLECTEGPEHNPTFISVVLIDGEFAGRGRGASKKISQQEAAAKALSQYKEVTLDRVINAEIEVSVDKPTNTDISSSEISNDLTTLSEDVATGQ
jgi:ribonuclease III